MEQALEQYGKKSTTIGQMRQNINISDFNSPIYVTCVDPPFKESFFINNGVSETSGATKYFWMIPDFPHNNIRIKLAQLKYFVAS